MDPEVILLCFFQKHWQYTGPVWREFGWQAFTQHRRRTWWPPSWAEDPSEWFFPEFKQNDQRGVTLHLCFFSSYCMWGGGAWGGKTYVKLPLIFLSFVGENHVNCILNIYKLERHSFSASRKAAAVERVFCCTDVCLKVSGWGALSHFTHHADARYQCGGEENTVGLGSVWSVFGGKCDLEVFFPGFLEFGGSKVNQTLECGNLDVFKRFRTFNGNHEAVEVWTYIGESPNFKHLRNSNKTFFKNLHLRFVETQQIG